MKTQYYLLMNEPKDTLYYLKANCNGALYTLTPETLRERQKGFMSLKAVTNAKKDFHVGILKISDKGMVRV
jgi:hypothetical protein